MSGNTYYHLITIKGSKEDMDKIYSILNSEGDSDFRLEKFYPIPEEIKKYDLDSSFEPVKKVFRRCSNGNESIEIVDKNGQNEQEYNQLRKELKDEFGEYQIYDWCVLNWGSGFEIEDSKNRIIKDTLYHCEFRISEGISDFVEFLSIDHPNLFIRLDFMIDTRPPFHSYTILRYNQNYVLVDNGISGVNMKYLGNGMSEFIDYNFPDIGEIDGELFFAVGIDPDENLNDFGLNPDNVINWDERKKFYKIIELGNYQEMKEEVDKFWIYGFNEYKSLI